MGDGTSDHNLRLPGGVIRFVTRRMGCGIHRLRNTMGGVGTLAELTKGRPSVSVTHSTVGRILGFGRPVSIAVGGVVGGIKGAFKVSPRGVVSSGHSGGVGSTERISVCVVHRVAKVGLISVKGMFGNGARSAMGRSVRIVRSEVGRGPIFGGAIRSVVGGVRRFWADFSFGRANFRRLVFIY